MNWEYSTDVKLKLDKSIEVKLVQSLNIFLISLTFDVSKLFPKLILFKLVQLSKIYPKKVTLDVSKLDKSTEIKDSHSLNICPK